MTAWKVTDQLRGVRMDKYRKRLSRVHHPKLNQVELLALELHVRQSLRERGEIECHDVDGEFLDHIYPSCSYGENKDKMDRLLSGEEQTRWTRCQ
jgi:hypothetical protein